MADKNQADFLLIEYNHLHESLYRGMVNTNSAARLYTALLAGAVGSVLLIASKGVDIKILLLCLAILSLFLFLVALLGCWLLVQNVRTYLKKLRAINSIRRYFLDLKPENAKYFHYPVTDSVPHVRNLLAINGIIYAAFVVVFFFTVTLVSWSLYYNLPRWATIIIGCCSLLLACLSLIIYLSRMKEKINNEIQNSTKLPPINEFYNKKSIA